MGTSIRVDDAFYQRLRASYEAFNAKMRQAYGREIDFTEYTKLVADDLEQATRPLSNPLLQPVKWGRKGFRLEPVNRIL